MLIKKENTITIKIVFNGTNLRFMINKWIFLLILSVPGYVLSGQSVALVLSGGGSKGLAHIGVIKALEENQVPIDYVGGTSIGAIIGSLYAIGLTPDEMVQIVKSENFENWVSGYITKEYRYFFKSEYPNPDIISIGFDLSDTIAKTQFPLSIIPSHLMDFAFMEIYSSASALSDYDFDRLYVPFLCVGSDISNSREVVFRKGDLAQAVRASMTFPVYFRPILIDGNIMYDGGIYNNFPVERVKEQFNPGFIIGSKAAQGNKPPDEFDIMAHIENMVMEPVDYHISNSEGILIDMKFENASLIDFQRIEEFVEIGYNTTLKLLDSIKMEIHRTGQDSADLAASREEFKSRLPDLIFNDIIIEGLNDDQKKYVEKSIRRNDATISLKELRSEYLKLVHDKNLKYIYPQAEFNPEDSLFKLRMRIIPQSSIEANFGLFFATSGQSQTYLGFSYRNLSEIAAHLKGNIQFGRLYDGVNLGVRFDYPAKTPAYFDLSFNINRFNFNQANTNFFFEDLKPSFIIQNQMNFRFDLGVPYTVNGIFQGGIAVGRNNDIYYQDKNFQSTDTSDVSILNQATVFVGMKRSTLNEKQFATSGDFRKFTIRAGYDSELYKPGSTSDLDYDQREKYFWFGACYKDVSYFKLSKYFTLGTTFVAQLTIKPLLSNYFATIIEAPVFNPNMITNGLFLEEYRANNYLAAGVMPVLNISNQIHLKLEGYGFFPVQEILKGEDNTAYTGNYFKSFKTIFSGSINVITPIGPISLNTSYLPEEDKKWIVQLSYGYLLFNRRTIEE